MNNGEKPLTISAKKLNCRCLTGFLELCYKHGKIFEKNSGFHVK